MAKPKKVKVEQILAGVCGMPPPPPAVAELPVPPPGKLLTTREAPGGHMLALTDQALHLLDAAGASLAQVDAADCKQVAVAGELAILMSHTLELRVFRIGATLDLVATGMAKKPGQMWSKDGRFFLCFGGKYWEITNLPS